MRIALIAAGLIEIPPQGHGALESLVYEYSQVLKELCHEVVIFNTKDTDSVIRDINSGNFDIAHLHFDCYYKIMEQLNCRCICSSHYPRIDQPCYWYGDNYSDIFHYYVRNANKYKIFAISEKDRNAYISAGVHPRDVFLMTNGASSDKFKFTETPSFGKRTVCLGQITPRKRQNLLIDLPQIDFIGRGPWPYSKGNYLGEVPSEYKHANLTEYGNLILLSDSENGTPLVIKEGLMAGCGIICSEGAAHELPRNLPFIRVLSELECQSPAIISQAIEINRLISLKMRSEIREWAKSQFEWKNLIKIYEGNLISLS